MQITLTSEEQAHVDACRERFELAENVPLRDKWNRLYALYRNYREVLRSHSGAPTEAGRDAVVRDAADEWGPELFIPMSFSTVETILPRMLSNRPGMLVTPRGRASAENVENMKQLIDSQQERIRYELVLQDTAKSGLIYGLGIQKAIWRRELHDRRRLKQNIDGSWGEETYQAGFDDPFAEDIDIFDFFWDPFAPDLERCRYAIHRTWRDARYVLDKIEAGSWRRADGSPIPVEEIESMGPSGKYDEATQDRMDAAGQSGWRGKRDGQPHEVWELWDQVDHKVITVVDRELPVSVQDCPYWHNELPFASFRPTTQGIKQLAGIGEIEPIEDLQREINTLRQQRRANASLVLNRIFAYAQGFVDEADLQSFPGAAIEVQAGNPRDVLMPIDVRDIPNSGYQEEANLLSDIERTTGISETTAGTGDASMTATGVQLVQAAANVRIQAKTTRIEVETAKHVTRLFVSMDQQYIRENFDLPIPSPPQPGVERRWTWIQLGPGELAGEFDIQPEGGTAAPENVPQMRQDAQVAMTLFGQHPGVDQRQVLAHAVRLMGVKHPESWILPDDGLPDSVKQAMAEIAEELGVDGEEFVGSVVEYAGQLEEEAAAGSPNEQPGEQAEGQAPAEG